MTGPAPQDSPPTIKVMKMDKAYWIRRKRAAMAAAREASTSEARLFHYDMAGRHSVRAANASRFMLVENGAAIPAEAEASRPARAPSIFCAPPPSRDHRQPGEPGDGA